MGDAVYGASPLSDWEGAGHWLWARELRFPDPSSDVRRSLRPMVHVTSQSLPEAWLTLVRQLGWESLFTSVTSGD